jgi:hypothetical protein
MSNNSVKRSIYVRAVPTVAALAFVLASFAAFSQESVDDEIGPAVDTSAIEINRAEEIDAVEPAVRTQDITRRTAGNRVMDSMQLGRSEITGNQELPKVLYIVPWKKADPGDLMGRPVNTLLDEVLAPIDREEFIRQIDYYNDLNGKKND